MSKRMIIFGAGGHAKTVVDTVEKAGIYEIAGLLDQRLPAGEQVYGCTVLGSDDWLSSHADTIDGAIVAIGDNWTRGLVVQSLKRKFRNLPFATAIHPSAQIARGARIGAGSVVMAGAVVNSDAIIGEHGILYPGTSVDHDSRIGSFVSFAPRCATGGNVSIGDYTAIAIGAVLIHGRTIGEHCVIGAGATVVSDVPPHTVAYGTPARAVRSRAAGERYL